jgi:serine/threonine protein kinase
VGKGSFGRVVRATHIASKQKWAIKLVPVTSEGLKEEIQALMRCNHPNVVRMQEYIVDQGQEMFGLVMELGHMDLHTYIEVGNVLEPSAIREVTLAMLKAVQYLHSQGICHMDIKSENLLLMKKNVPIRQEYIKLCDFGLCTIAPPGQTVVTETMLKGTPRFFAPEMANFVPFNANAADMWSIGCTLLDLTDEMPEEWEHSYALYNDTDDLGRHGFKTGLRRILRLMSDDDYFDNNSPVFDLMRGLLKFKPHHRLTANEVLQHSWLQE